MKNIRKEPKLHNKEIGKYGEEIVSRYLENLGYIIICRNFITSTAEIDIISIDKDEYVFIEVKTRVSKKYGTPASAVNFNKQKHIINTAKYYIYKNFLQNKNIRFDVIEVYMNRNNILINHIENAFSY